MQLYALDERDQPISANRAEKGKHYRCCECQSRVHVRGGWHRQNHFYHLQPNHHCRLNGKGMIHLQIQAYLKSILSNGDCQLEQRFPQINRIADVAWISQKIVFEVQCSPISAQEVQERLSDYSQLGWKVVWILHDKLYNQKRLTAAEWALRFSPCYYSNIDQEGRGDIYDQFDLFDKGLRQLKLSPFPVNLAKVTWLASEKQEVHSSIFMNRRLQHWPLSFQGDLIDLASHIEKTAVFLEIQKIEQSYYATQLNASYLVKNLFYHIFVHPYLIFFQILLEKACRS
jgi:competence protein CoiA